MGENHKPDNNEVRLELVLSAFGWEPGSERMLYAALFKAFVNLPSGFKKFFFFFSYHFPWDGVKLCRQNF